MTKTKTEKIASIETEIQQLANKRKQLIQAQKKEERNARTKRLCRRMGLFESMLPETISLTDEQFQIFLEQTVATDSSRRLLENLTAQNDAAAAPIRASAAAQGNTPPAHNHAHTEPQNGADEDGDEDTAQG